MNWNFSAWAIRNPVPPILAFVVFMALGIYSFLNMPITKFPNIDVPVIMVNITDSGSAPSELETQVTKKVEDTLSSVSGVKHVTSTITDGSSTTVAEFRLEVNTDRALNDVKDAIAKIRGNLPRTIDEPVIQRVDVEGQAIQTYAADAPAMTPEELSWFVDDTLIRELQTLKGVGRVERIGGVKREIQVQLDPDRLMALGITASQVNAQLRATSVDLSGGKGEIGGQSQAIRTLAGAKSIKDLGDTRIVLAGGREVRLAELGTITDGWEEPKSFARLDGKPVVAFSIYRAKGASDTSVSDVVAAKVGELQKQYPDIRMSRIDDSVFYTYGNYESAMETLFEGALLACIVVLLFLRDMRATIIAAVALPLSAIPTFWAMSMMGFSLNLISLLGITLVTGILVDDAIVEIENIVRHIRMGKKPYKAALEAADEIGLAVIAISATIIAIFAPVSFMGGVAGQYFKQFGLTVAVAVFFSLLVARFITPMMAAFFMRSPYIGDGTDGRPRYKGYSHAVSRASIISAVLAVAFLGVMFAVATVGPSGVGFLDSLATRLEGYGWPRVMIWTGVAAFVLARVIAWLGRPHPEEEHDGFFMRIYTGFLHVTLWRVPLPIGRRRVLRFPMMPLATIAFGLGVFLVAMDATKYLPQGFIPPVDESRIVTSVELPPGSQLDDTRAKSDEIVRRLEQLPEIKSVFVMGGTSPTGTLENRRAAVYINLVDKLERDRSQKEMQGVVAGILADVPDIRSYFVNDRGDREATVGILGRDGALVEKAAADLEAAMRRDPIFANPAALASFARPEIRILPKLDQTADLGISTDAISETIRVATAGDAGGNLAKFTVGDRQIPIRVQLVESARGDLGVLSSLRVPTASGSVPIASVADVTFGQGPSTIERYDRERLVKVGTDMAVGHATGEGLDKIMALDVVKNFPDGVRIQSTGDAEIQGEVFSGFATAMIAGIMMVFVVLILLFNSVIQPITILASLPLSVGGVVGALLITNNPVSMPVVIGILMLMGIVTKNAIMLVDFAVEREKHGLSQKEAIIDAGRKRARPIIMTTIAMGAGMMPAALGVGQGGEFRAPMAIGVIGGLIVSTILSLVFIPSFYSVMGDVSRFIGWAFRVIARPNERDEGDSLGVAGHPLSEADLYRQVEADAEAEARREPDVISQEPEPAAEPAVTPATEPAVAEAAAMQPEPAPQAENREGGAIVLPMVVPGGPRLSSDNRPPSDKLPMAAE